jgi:hypothetical protein
MRPTIEIKREQGMAVVYFNGSRTGSFYADSEDPDSFFWDALLYHPWMLGQQYERLHPVQQEYVLGLVADKLVDQVYLECQQAVLRDHVFTGRQDDPRTGERITDPKHDYLMGDDDFCIYLDLVAHHCAENYPHVNVDELRGKRISARRQLIAWGQDVLRKSPSYNPVIETVFETATRNLVVADELVDKLMRISA